MEQLPQCIQHNPAASMKSMAPAVSKTLETFACCRPEQHAQSCLLQCNICYRALLKYSLQYSDHENPVPCLIGCTGPLDLYPFDLQPAALLAVVVPQKGRTSNVSLCHLCPFICRFRAGDFGIRVLDLRLVLHYIFVVFCLYIYVISDGCLYGILLVAPPDQEQFNAGSKDPQEILPLGRLEVERRCTV